MTFNKRNWKDHFRIQSLVDLDFVVGQEIGYPIGMLRTSPPEYRRRVVAGAASYQLQLQSIDYTMKHYINKNLYEKEDILFGDIVSDFVKNSLRIIEEELKKLHHNNNLTSGVLGAEISLYKVPYTLDVARMMANRGLLLEVIPILRLCLEMISWANVAFHMNDESKVKSLKAQNCITNLKNSYSTAGNLYGYLSNFGHWNHNIHSHFLGIEDDNVMLLRASVRYRVMSLALCIVILDILLHTISLLYSKRGNVMVRRIQGVLDKSVSRKTYKVLSKIAKISKLDDLNEIRSFLVILEKKLRQSSAD